LLLGVAALFRLLIREKDAMAKVEYPTDLTKARWDKKKPLVVASRKTGIGEMLTALEADHGKIKWTSFVDIISIVDIDKKLVELPDLVRKTIVPYIQLVKAVQKKATEWSATFKKEKLTPKAASEACDMVADAAKKFISDLEDFQGAAAKEMVDSRKEKMGIIRQMIKPGMTKVQKKLEGLIDDIKNYAKTPTKDKFFETFGKDCNARGFTTGCKNWDQWLSEFPELRDQCHKGKAMDDFFPVLKDYGAEWDPNSFEQKVNSKLGLDSEEACFKEHAKILIKATPTINKFKAAVDKLLTLVG
jgi:hypothetical protein